MWQMTLANDDDVIKTFPCQGDRAETGRSRMPTARMRHKGSAYAPSRSRIK
jgi:hypothetical protein